MTAIDPDTRCQASGLAAVCARCPVCARILTHTEDWRLPEHSILSESEYAVYELRTLHHLSLRQTAQALDLSISTIRSTEERIERKLRRAA